MSAFVEGLAQLGWKNGRNVRIDVRWSSGDPTGLRAHAADLVSLQPDAMLEDPARKRRYLIEFETGSATVRNAQHKTATETKIGRYSRFLLGPVHVADPQTYYSKQHVRHTVRAGRPVGAEPAYPKVMNAAAMVLHRLGR